MATAWGNAVTGEDRVRQGSRVVDMTEVTVSVGSSTDVGRVRDHNEDALLVTDRLWAVADGMGGHAAGEVASALTVEVLGDVVRSQTEGALTTDLVVSAVDASHRALHQSMKLHREQRGMGTTLTGVALVSHDDQDCWAVFNIGDSRVYRLHAGELVQVTTDHSEVQELIDAGVITAAEVAVHPARNIITRSLGMPAPIAVDVWLVPIETEQTFLICSDGLTNEVADAELARILGSSADPQTVADLLVETANDHGGMDNISVIVVRAEAGSAPPG